MLAGLDVTSFPRVAGCAWPVVAGIAIRQLHIQAARDALTWARHAACEAAIPALMAEVESAALVLSMPAARLIARGEVRALLLEEVEALLASGALVVDACRQSCGTGDRVVSLATRPSSSRWPAHWAKPGPATCPETRCSPAFSGRNTPTNRIARDCASRSGGCARSLRPLAEISATERGFVLAPSLRPRHRRAGAAGRRARSAVLALLADGESWSKLGPGDRARRQPAHRAALARCPRGGGQGPVVRPRPRGALDDAAGAGFPDKLVTPRPAAGRLGWRHEAISGRNRPRVRAGSSMSG